MQTTATAATVPVTYEADFALWGEAQITALRSGRWADLDIEHLIEEIDGLTRRDRREIRSRLTVVILHLLKLHYRPDRATRSWRTTVKIQVAGIGLILDDSPSLRREMPHFARVAYRDARSRASDETDSSLETFPETPTLDFKRALGAVLAGQDVDDPAIAPVAQPRVARR